MKRYRYLVLFELYRPDTAIASPAPYHVSRVLETRRPISGGQIEHARRTLADDMDLEYTPAVCKCDLIPC